MSAQLDIDEPPESKLSTPQLAALLREKYPREKYALIFDVPDAVSLDQKRRIDAVAFGCWASLGRRIEGFELKVSRSDWLRELRQVDKADPFIALCDLFWLVTADAKVAKLEEVPAAWGWMTATKSGLRIQRPASPLPGCGPSVPRAFVIGIMRRMQDDLLKSPDVAAYIAGKIKEIQDGQENAVKWATQRARNDADRLQKAVNEFEEASGIKFQPWRMGNVGHIVKQLLELGYGEAGGLRTVERLLEQHENALRTTLAGIQSVRASLNGEHSSQNGSAVTQEAKP